MREITYQLWIFDRRTPYPHGTVIPESPLFSGGFTCQKKLQRLPSQSNQFGKEIPPPWLSSMKSATQIRYVAT
jgi:hypothetical protein